MCSDQSRRHDAGAVRWLASLLIVLAACAAPSVSGGEPFVLASTTSTQDSGLLDSLTRAFEAAHPGLRVKVIAVGSGEALELARHGDADVLLAHSPAQEERFMQEGFGVYRRAVMRNNFIVVGPGSDPAGVRRSGNAGEAFASIARSGAEFVSRGDESGTHARELAIWERAGVGDLGRWHLETGQGMGETLVVASERGAYTLTDTATYRVMERRLRLEVLLPNDPELVNPYSVIPVRRAGKPKAAAAFAQWITGPRGQAFIGEFGRKEYGAPLFVPTANR